MQKPFLLILLAGLVLSVASPADAQRRRRARAGAQAPRVTLRDLPTIAPKLNSASSDEVREAIDLLVVIDHRDVVPHLAELLRSGRSDAITNRALEALRGLARAESIEVLTEFSTHRRVSARRRAYAALAAIEDDRISGLLQRGLRDSDRSVRGAVALALGNIGATDAIDILFRAFDRNVIEAAIAIGKLGNEESIERFSTYLGQRSLGVVLSGYDQYLRRDDISEEAKLGIVDRLGEVAGGTVREFLSAYLRTFSDRDRSELKQRVDETIRRIPEGNQGQTIAGAGQ